MNFTEAESLTDMCWKCDTFTAKVKIANKNVKVYKFFYSDNLFAPFVDGYQYTLGQLNEEVPLRLVKSWDRCSVCIHEGYHSYINMQTYCKRAGATVGESLYACIIPKGSTYYVNDNGLCVSSNIIIKRKVNPTLVKFINKIVKFFNKQ